MIHSIESVALKYLDFAWSYYGDPRGEYSTCRCAVKELILQHGTLDAHQFGPLKLKDFRDHLVSKGWSRNYVNSVINRIRRMFRWLASEQLVPASLVHSLEMLDPLRRGRTAAKELKPRLPVNWNDIDVVLPILPQTLHDMVMLQWHTGVRSMSVCKAEADQFAEKERILFWSPDHKSKHLGRELDIPLGPNALRIITPYLQKTGFLFNPPRGGLNYRKQYTSTTYRQALQRAQKRVGIRDLTADPPKLGWVPHQIRHSHATRVRAKFGVEAAQVALGHARCDVTQIYAQRSFQLAIEIAKEFG